MVPFKDQQSTILLENVSPQKSIKSNFAYFSGSWAWPLFPLHPIHKAPGRVSYIQGKCTVKSCVPVTIFVISPLGKHH